MTWTFNDWYKTNRKALSKKRKAKYRQDKIFRESVKKRARDHYRNRTKDRVPYDRLSVRDDSGVHFITIGRLSKMLGRKTQTIRGYHASKVIPPCTVFDQRGWRLYSPKQAMLLRKAFGMFDRGELVMLNDVKQFILNGWEEK